MDENLHDIDDLFRNAINEHRDAPSAGVWENIDKNLDKKNIVSISKKYRKLKWAAAAMLIFSAGLAMYTWNTKLKNKELVKHYNSTLKKLTEKDKTSGKTAFNNSTNRSAFARDSSSTLLAKEQNKNKSAQASISKNIVDRNEKAVALARTSKAAMNTAHRKTTIAASTASNKAVAKQVASLAADKSIASKTQINSHNYQTELTKNKQTAGSNSEDKTIERTINDIAVVSSPRIISSILPTQNIGLQERLETQTASNRIKTDERINSRNIKNLAKKAILKPSFSATIFYSPDFVSSRVNEDRHNFREDDRNAIKSKEQIKSASTVGLLLNYATRSPISFQTGITFSTFTTNIKPKTIYARPDDRGNINYRFNCSAGYSFVSLKNTGTPPASGDSITALNSTNTLQYITVPVAVAYKIGKGRFTVNPAIGLGVNLLTKGKIETVFAGAGGDEKASINHIDGLNNAYFTGALSVAANYSLNSFLSLSFMPTARFALTAINKDVPVKTYLNSFGLAAGLNVKL